MEKDEFAGQGGSYIVGKDGKRQLVHRTQEAQAPAQEPAAPAAVHEQASTKAKKGT